MCGINGILAYHYSANPIDRAELARTRDHMAARGPDGKGEWIADDGRVGFGHRRLSIIDLTDKGAQPMASADGSIVVTFNGEIYNHRELRRDLEAKGCRFRSNSDTEVLLHLYAEKGEAMVHDLRGMFAFAIWDGPHHRLLMARDPYGIKPLYYADDGRTLRFASQVKALIAGGAVPADLDTAGVVGFHVFGSVPEPFTINRHVRTLPAGHSMIVGERGREAPRCFYTIAAAYFEGERSPAARLRGADRLAAARANLLDSVHAHLVADVPVGAFLSAGIDSGGLVGLMRDAGQSEIETVTLSFKEFEGSANDEAPVAAEVARTYGTRHTTRTVTKAEFETELPRILDAMDQPSIDGINTWFVSKAARERGLKVAISGVGGDELLGGYPSFRDIPKWVGWLSAPAAIPGLGGLVRRAAMAVGPHRLHLSPKVAGILEYGGAYEGAWLLRRGLYMPWELEGILEPEIVRDGLSRLAPLAIVRAALDPTPVSGFARVATMEAALYMRNQLLRDSDWASMAHSLEVRTPLVDAVLLQHVAAMGPPDPELPSKQELAAAPSVPLPKAVTDRKKTGFAVPVAPWTSARPSSGNRPAPYGYARDWAHTVARLNAGLEAPAPVAA
jgi:asparagine synthase (glutamine-hydrolysing)